MALSNAKTSIEPAPRVSVELGKQASITSAAADIWQVHEYVLAAAADSAAAEAMAHAAAVDAANARTAAVEQEVRTTTLLPSLMWWSRLQ